MDTSFYLVILVLMLVAFILGLVAGVSISRPTIR